MKEYYDYLVHFSYLSKVGAIWSGTVTVTVSSKISDDVSDSLELAAILKQKLIEDGHEDIVMVVVNQLTLLEVKKTQ